MSFQNIAAKTSEKKTTFIKAVVIVFFFGCVVGNSSYALATVDESFFHFLLGAGLAVSLIIWLRSIKLKLSFSVNGFILMQIMVLALIFTIAVNRDNDWFIYLRQICVIAFAYFLSRILSFRDFCRHFIQFMKVITIIALIVHFIYNILNIRLPLPIVTNINNVNYYNGILFFVQAQAINRCMGVFWEPSIFSAFLTLAILLEVLFMDRKPSIFNIALFVAGVLFSFATTGYLLLIIVFLIICNRVLSRRVSTLINIVAIIGIVLLLTAYQDILIFLARLMPEIFYKMTFESNSVMVRLRSPIADFLIFQDHVLFGSGIKQYNVLWAELAASMDIQARTSTITYYIAAFGLSGLLYLFFITAASFRISGQSLFAKIAMFVLLCGIVTAAPYNNNVLLFMILFYMYGQRTKETKEPALSLAGARRYQT